MEIKNYEITLKYYRGDGEDEDVYYRDNYVMTISKEEVKKYFIFADYDRLYICKNMEIINDYFTEFRCVFDKIFQEIELPDKVLIIKLRWNILNVEFDFNDYDECYLLTHKSLEILKNIIEEKLEVENYDMNDLFSDTLYDSELKSYLLSSEDLDNLFNLIGRDLYDTFVLEI